MSAISLERVINPVEMPITVAEAKLYTRIAGNTEDALVTTWIKAGCLKAENYQRRSFVTQSWRLTLDSFPPVTSAIYLPRQPLRSLTSISYTKSDGTIASFAITKFIVDTDASTITLKENETWPEGIELNNLKITYESGYGAAANVPAYVADALYVYVGYRYENRVGETDLIPRLFYQILDEKRLWSGLESIVDENTDDETLFYDFYS